MSNRNDIYSKYYDSDIFNTNPTDNPIQVTKPKPKKNQETYESTKENVFNIGKERRIRRNINRNELDENPVLSRSAAKRTKNYEKIYGSDIFNKGRPTSTERRRGVRQVPNTTQQSNYLKEMGDNDEYVKDLKYYTKQHRAEKKEYNPDLYIYKVTPQERYYKEHFDNHGSNVLPEEKIKRPSGIDEQRLNDYIYNKINLNNDIKQYNNERADRVGAPGPDNINYKEKRYFRQKPKGYEGKRNFLDSEQFPVNNCRINKQIQMESHIFANADDDKDFNVEVKEINDRLEKEKRKHYHLNVLGLPYQDVKTEPVNKDRNIYGAPKSKWNRTNLDWSSPECQVLFNNSNRKQTARERKINQLSDSQNIDIFTGEPKKPINYRMAEKQISNDRDAKRINEIVKDIPNLNEGQRLGIKMKVSALDCNNDREWDNKEKLLNDFYVNKKPNRGKEVTEKINSRKDRTDNDNINNENTYHDYVITYSTKGNQFEKFDEADIQKIFGNKGIQTYDIHKNPFDKGNYNTINIKIKGNDANNQLYDKVKKVQEDLRRQNYKVNIEKGAVKNIGNHGKLVNNPGSKAGIMQDSINYENSKYTTMPNEMRARKGFTKEFAQVNHKYKKPNW
jgi:hypothetical protein